MIRLARLSLRLVRGGASLVGAVCVTGLAVSCAIYGLSETALFALEES